jgi:hypothetical protein
MIHLYILGTKENKEQHKKKRLASRKETEKGNRPRKQKEENKSTSGRENRKSRNPTWHIAYSPSPLAHC